MNMTGHHCNRFLAFLLAGQMLALPAIGAVQAADQLTGTLTGSIGDTMLDKTGKCSQSGPVFQFWTDGDQFPVHKDSDGDGMYFAVMVNSQMPGSVGSLQYGRDGEKIYSGTFPFTYFDGGTLTVDGQIGARSGQSGMPAAFNIVCASKPATE